jgi:hypothetical protein
MRARQSLRKRPRSSRHRFFSSSTAPWSSHHHMPGWSTSPVLLVGSPVACLDWARPSPVLPSRSSAPASLPVPHPSGPTRRSSSSPAVPRLAASPVLFPRWSRARAPRWSSSPAVPHPRRFSSPTVPVLVGPHHRRPCALPQSSPPHSRPSSSLRLAPLHGESLIHLGCSSS